MKDRNLLFYYLFFAAVISCNPPTIHTPKISNETAIPKDTTWRILRYGALIKYDQGNAMSVVAKKYGFEYLQVAACEATQALQGTPAAARDLRCSRCVIGSGLAVFTRALSTRRWPKAEVERASDLRGSLDPKAEPNQQEHDERYCDVESLSARLTELMGTRYSRRTFGVSIALRVVHCFCSHVRITS